MSGFQSLSTWTSSIDPLRSKEKDVLLQARGEVRAKYFRTTAIDHGWTVSLGEIAEDDYADLSLWGDSEEVETVSLWPHPEYIDSSLTDEKKSTLQEENESPLICDIETLLYVLCPILQAEKMRIGVFPVQDVFADVLDPQDFVQWMEEAF